MSEKELKNIVRVVDYAAKLEATDIARLKEEAGALPAPPYDPIRDALACFNAIKHVAMTISQARKFAETGHDELKAAQARPSDGWQPIASAPTDGTRILLCTGSCDPEYYHLATWDGEHSHPFIPNKWTHWMPLPSPPTPEPGS